MAAESDTPQNYFGLEEEFSAQENSRAVVVPVPYEGATRYGKGTKKGPKAILEASQYVELFDDELWIEPYKIGIHTGAVVKIAPVTSASEQPFRELYEAITPIVEFGKFPIAIGGDHALSIGSVMACAEKFPDLSILQVGAHADLRESDKGNPYGHAAVNYQLYKLLPSPLITQVGVRSISSEEVSWLEQTEPNINMFWARHQAHWNFHEIVHSLSNDVYLSIDVSGFDPSLMPSTGAPEPGGMSWFQLTELIKLLCIRKNVVAADIVEFSPLKDLLSPDFLVAKLLYKTIAYRFAMELGVTKKYL